MARWKMLLAVSGLVISGCAADDVTGQNTRAGRPPAAAQPDPTGIVAARRVVIASVALSPTHHVEFAGYPDLKLVGYDEEFHRDRDRDAARLADLVPADAPLDEAYAAIAAGQLDPAVVAALRDAATGNFTTLAADALPSVQAEPPPPATGEAETQQALCSEPLWDWVGDANWFQAGFCDPFFQYCKELLPSHANSQRNKFSISSYFNESFCSATHYALTWTEADACDIFGCTIRTFLIESGTVANRFVHTASWHSTGTDADDQWPAWNASMSSDQGNFTAMSQHTFTQ